jgi:hypothetical protein
MEERGTEVDDDHGDVMPVAESVEGSPGERRFSSLAVLGGAVLVGFAALTVLVALLVVSPASFVSLLPGWFTEDGSGRTVAWLIAGLSAAAAAVLAVRRDPAQRLRGVMITVLVVVAGGFGMLALKSGPTREGPAPTPENTCVAYSGGRHTCPGG